MKNYNGKLYQLTRLWLLLQATQFLYIGSSWVVVRKYFKTSITELLPVENSPTVDHEIIHEPDKIDEFFCQKGTELFGLMWFTIVSLSVTISLILVLRQNRTRIAIGFFIGVSATMANWTLVYAVKSGQILIKKQKYSGEDQYKKKAIEISTFLGLVLTSLYALFSVLLFSYADDIVDLPVRDKPTSSDPTTVDTRTETIFVLENEITSPVTSTSESVVQH